MYLQLAWQAKQQLLRSHNLVTFKRVDTQDYASDTRDRVRWSGQP